jgi:GT2 family glycosyltransferase
MRKPELSIVIPVHGGFPEVYATLEALRTQTGSHANFEVLVVDDSHYPRQRRKYTKPTSFQLNYLSVRACNVAKARNFGINHADGRIVGFLDKGVVPSQDWVQNTISLHQSHKNTVILGYTFGLELSPSEWPLFIEDDLARQWRTSHALSKAESEPDLSDYRWTHRRKETPWAFFWTCNASAPLDLITRAGGFDEEFQSKGSEDIELGFRLWLEGARFTFSRKVTAFHRPHQRHRTNQMRIDRRNEFRFLCKFPRIEVECCVSFDCAHENYVLPILQRIVHKAIATYKKVKVFSISAVPNEYYSGQTLLVGCFSPRMPRVIPCDLALTGDPELAKRMTSRFRSVLFLPLFGTAMPFKNKRYRTGILTDFWRMLPEPLLARVLQEMARVCQRVLLLKTTTFRVPSFRHLRAPFLPCDMPYWSRVYHVSRSLADFRFQTIDSNQFQSVIEAKPNFPRIISFDPSRRHTS